MNGENQPSPQPSNAPEENAASPKLELKLDIPYREKISRLFIFRWLWAFVMMWPLIPWAIWVGLVNFAHFWYMLILGKRHELMWKKNARLFRHTSKWSSYFKCLTDKRPKFVED